MLEGEDSTLVPLAQAGKLHSGWSSKKAQMCGLICQACAHAGE